MQYAEKIFSQKCLTNIQKYAIIISQGKGRAENNGTEYKITRLGIK